jgi:phosphopantetheinyl transferase
MNPLYSDLIAVLQSLSAQRRRTSHQPCTDPFFFDLATLTNSLDEQNIAKEWLSNVELTRFESFKFKKRRQEWLAGRICAKMALYDYFCTYSPEREMESRTELSIMNLDTGRPFPTGRKGERLVDAPDLSISHSGSLALALAAKTCCGIDIQQMKDTLIRIKKRFCTEEEERLLMTTLGKGPLVHLALLWSAKEAIRKALGHSVMPGFLDLILTSADTAGHPAWLFSFRWGYEYSEIITITASYNNYGIGICIP